VATTHTHTHGERESVPRRGRAACPNMEAMPWRRGASPPAHTTPSNRQIFTPASSTSLSSSYFAQPSSFPCAGKSRCLHVTQ
jgi:hypothetical protein